MEQLEQYLCVEVPRLTANLGTDHARGENIKFQNTVAFSVNSLKPHSLKNQILVSIHTGEDNIKKTAELTKRSIAQINDFVENKETILLKIPPIKGYLCFPPDCLLRIFGTS